MIGLFIKLMRVLGPVILAVILVFITIFGVQAYLVQKNPWEQKIAQARSVMYYTVAKEQPIKLTIYPTDRELRLITHLILAKGTTYDPNKNYKYGLRLNVVGKNDLSQWSHEYWVETRQSKAESVGDLWAMECAFTTSDVQISDDRITYVALPEGIPKGESVLKVELLGFDHGSAIIRGYRNVERTPLEIAKLEISLPEEEKIELANKLFRNTWRELTPYEREYLLMSRWERVTPDGVSGLDYNTMQVYFTGFHLPKDYQSGESGHLVAPNRAIVINLKGPSSIELFAKTAAKPSTYEEQKNNIQHIALSGPINASLKVKVVKNNGLTAERKWNGEVVDNDYTSMGVFSANKNEVVSISFKNISDTYLSLYPLLKGAKEEVLLGKADLRPSPKKIGPSKIIYPKPRYYNAYRIIPGMELPTFPLFAPSGTNGDMVRVLTYIPFTKGDPDFLKYKVDISILDEYGVEVYSNTISGETERSDYEDYIRSDPADTRYPGAAQIAFVKFPAGSHKMVLSAERPIDVIVQMPICLYCEDEPDLGFEMQDETLRWRNEILKKSRWMAVKTDNEKDLSKQNSLVTIRAQSRIEPVEEVELDPQMLFEVLEPTEKVSCSYMLEQDSEDNPTPDEEWTYATYHEILPGKQYTLNVPKEFVGRPVILRYDIGDSEVIRKGLRIKWDDNEIEKRKLRTVVGEIAYRTTEGQHKLLLEGQVENARYWVNVPISNARTKDKYFTRKVCKLENGQKLTLPVMHKAGYKQSINVLAYQTMSNTNSLRLKGKFDGGIPRLQYFGVSTGITPAWKVMQMDYPRWSGSILEAARGLKVSYAQPMIMTLFEEAGIGKHNLTIHHESGDQAVWIRAFVSIEKQKPGKGYMIWKAVSR